MEAELTELKVLSVIGENNPNITQRDLSARTNLSLGAINVLLKKMMDKGFIKIEKLSARTVRYMLTPKGMAEKAVKTYNFVRRTYENVLLMRNELTLIVQDLPERGRLYLYGDADEVYNMIVMLINEITSERKTIVKEYEPTDEFDKDGIIVVWSDAYANRLTADVKYINILNRIV